MNAQIQIVTRIIYSLTVADKAIFEAKYKTWEGRQALDRSRRHFLAALATRLDRKELSTADMKEYGVSVYVVSGQTNNKFLKPYKTQ